MFVDYVEIEAESGAGGHGCIAFRTEKYEPRGGPEGGDGGRGGDVVLVADPQLTTLMDFRYKRKYKGDRGANGGGGQRTGKSADPIKLRLPVGTIIKDLDTGEILADLDTPHEEVVLLRGGKGGWGNARYKSSTNQAPRKAQDGHPGEFKRLALS